MNEDEEAELDRQVHEEHVRLAEELKEHGCAMDEDGNRMDIDTMRKLVGMVCPVTVVQEGWKIRHIQSGLFTKGGGMPMLKCRSGWHLNAHTYANKNAGPECCFHKTGKLWNARHHLESHMRNNMDWYCFYADELEVIKVQSVVSEVVPMRDHYEEVERFENQRQTKRDKEQAERKIEHLKEKQVRLEQEKQDAAAELARLQS